MLSIVIPIQEAMHNFVHDMLHSSPAAQRMYALWKVPMIIRSSGMNQLMLNVTQEYEDGQSAEAKFVKGK